MRAPQASRRSSRRRPRRFSAAARMKSLPRHRRCSRRSRRPSQSRSASQASRSAKLPGAQEGILPVFVEPSSAAVGAAAPSGERWLHEIKYRRLSHAGAHRRRKGAASDPQGARLDRPLSHCRSCAEELPVGSALIDGEIDRPGRERPVELTRLQSDLKSGRKDRLIYCAFDLLYLEGVDLQGSALDRSQGDVESGRRALPAIRSSVSAIISMATARRSSLMPASLALKGSSRSAPTLATAPAAASTG